MNINRSFWDLTFPERKLWLDSHIYIAPVRNRANAEVEQYKRSHSLSYLLPLATSKEAVCKVMFLATLGLKTDGIVAVQYLKTPNSLFKISLKTIFIELQNYFLTQKTQISN